MRQLILIIAVVTLVGCVGPKKEHQVQGVNGGMYVQNSEGQFEVEWTKATRVAIEKKAKEKK
jgi:hypothetical protein